MHKKKKTKRKKTRKAEGKDGKNARAKKALITGEKQLTEKAGGKRGGTLKVNPRKQLT